MEHAQIPEALKPKDDLHQFTDSPLNGDAPARRFSSDSPHQRQGDPLKKGSRMSGGGDRSVEQSPLHHNQAKPSWERKGSAEGSHAVAPNTPGRYKTRTPGRGDESPEKGTAVPKFGEWDESNPATGDGFTDIFNKVRAEKQTGSAKVPQITDDSQYLNNSYGHGGNHKSPSCSCFSWFK